MKFIDDAKLKFGVWNRERKERAEERKVRDAEPAGVTIPLSLVRSAKFAAWMAYFSLVYFLWLYTLDIARDRAAALHLTHAGGWIGDIQFYFPYIVGFAVVAVGIPYVAKIAIPTFMSLSWRGEFWAKLWSLFIAFAVSIVVIAGTFTVQGDTIMERDRDAAVAVEGVEQEAAVLAARIADTRAELDDMVNNSSVYVRTAASMSPEAYDVFVEQRRDDWQYQRLLSYRATSVDAERLRNEITALRDQQARQTTVASVQGEVVTERTGWIADTLGWLEGVRAILLSLVMDIVCLIMPWIALRLEQARNRQLGVAGGIPQHPWMIEKPRDGEKPRVGPETFAGRRAQDVVDAMIAGGADPRFAADMARSAARATAPDELAFDEDGTPLTRVEYYKRTDGKPLVKNQKNKVVVPPGPIPPDETGVTTDGGKRTAVTLGGEMELPESVNGEDDERGQGAPDNDAPEADAEAKADEAVAVVTQPEPSEEADEPAVDAMELELAAAVDEATDEPVEPTPVIDAEPEQVSEGGDDGEVNEDAEPDHHETSEREEPETDPKKLIAAE